MSTRTSRVVVLLSRLRVRTLMFINQSGYSIIKSCLECRMICVCTCMCAYYKIVYVCVCVCMWHSSIITARPHSWWTHFQNSAHHTGTRVLSSNLVCTTRHTHIQRSRARVSMFDKPSAPHTRTLCKCVKQSACALTLYATKRPPERECYVAAILTHLHALPPGIHTTHANAIETIQNSKQLKIRATTAYAGHTTTYRSVLSCERNELTYSV